MWTSEGSGREFQLSPTLEPLEPFKDQTLVLSNLWNAAANTGDGHYVKESSILTCTTISKTLGVDLNMHGVSMDQVAAAMGSIKQASTQNVTSAKRLETSARNLNELGQRLKQMIERYKV